MAGSQQLSRLVPGGQVGQAVVTHEEEKLGPRKHHVERCAPCRWYSGDPERSASTREAWKAGIAGDHGLDHVQAVAATGARRRPCL